MYSFISVASPGLSEPTFAVRDDGTVLFLVRERERVADERSLTLLFRSCTVRGKRGFDRSNGASRVGLVRPKEPDFAA